MIDIHDFCKFCCKQYYFNQWNNSIKKAKSQGIKTLRCYLEIDSRHGQTDATLREYCQDTIERMIRMYKNADIVSQEEKAHLTNLLCKSLGVE
jgi:hypothetical protein